MTSVFESTQWVSDSLYTRKTILVAQDYKYRISSITWIYYTIVVVCLACSQTITLWRDSKRVLIFSFYGSCPFRTCLSMALYNSMSFTALSNSCLFAICPNTYFVIHSYKLMMCCFSSNPLAFIDPVSVKFLKASLCVQDISIVSFWSSGPNFLVLFLKT